MSAAAATLQTLQVMQTHLYALATLNLTAWQYPPDCSVKNGSIQDFIIVGGGTAGCVLAGRLSELNASVMLVETGGYPPIESELPGTFAFLPSSVNDHNLTTINNNYTFQNNYNHVASLNQGKMLGGTSGTFHMMHSTGDPNDYDTWAQLLNDTAWNNTNVRSYYKKSENLKDTGLLNSTHADVHGKDGPQKIERELTSSWDEYLNALNELGNNIVPDTTSMKSSLGYTQPLYTIYGGKRISTASAYLAPAKYRTNLCLTLSTKATKILVVNNTAIGIQVTRANGDIHVYYARKEVIITAGAFNSPKLLLLSGIGPKEDLESLGIPVVADLPVGKYLQDQPTTVIAYKTVKTNATPPEINPNAFPVPSIIGLVSLNSTQSFPDYMTISLLLPRQTSATLQSFLTLFRYSFNISDEFYLANQDSDIFLTAVAVARPKSRGRVWLASADPEDKPLIDLGVFNDPSDLDLLVKSVKNLNRLMNTTFFKENNASLINPGLCANVTDEDEFWKCFVEAMTFPMSHFSGSCAMGPVLDSSMRVRGIPNLRVADSSAIPTEISGKLHAAVVMVAERASELIANDWGIAN